MKLVASKKSQNEIKLISWNVNGIRAVIKKGFLNFINKEKPDVLCLQETKARPEQVEIDEELSELGYTSYWNSAMKKGYSGTVIFTKLKPISVVNDIQIGKHDQEGRVITMEFKKYFLVNVYTPNSKRGLERLDYRQKEWDVDFLKYLKKLEKTKSVIFCGDLNVAHKEIDLARPKDNHKNAGFTNEERGGFNNIIKAGFIDSYRQFYPEKTGAYSWWSYFRKARDRNIGWRIDYFCVSSALKQDLKDAFILPEVMGSDHCPIGIIIKT